MCMCLRNYCKNLCINEWMIYTHDWSRLKYSSHILFQCDVDTFPLLFILIAVNEAVEYELHHCYTYGYINTQQSSVLLRITAMLL